MYSRIVRPILAMLVVQLGFVAMGEVAAAETFNIKNCKITFETTGTPVLVRITGSSNKPCEGSVTVDGGVLKSGTLTMDLSDINTGIPLRNKHLRENYLHTDKFPVATVKMISVPGVAEQLAGKAKGANEFKAMLNLHGKDAELKATEYSISGKKVKAKFRVDLLDHEVPYPSFMGVKVVDKVHCEAEFDI